MDERQELAVAALAEGKSVEEAAKDCGRTPRTVHKWVKTPAFQGALLESIQATALLKLAQYLGHGGDPREVQAAIAILRWRLTAKAGKETSQGRSTEDDPETDLEEFSAEQLSRLTGDG